MDRQAIKAWVPVGVWATVIMQALTRTSFGPLESLTHDYTAALAHLVLWAMLGLLVARALRHEGLARRSVWWLGLAICVAYGIGTEAVQTAHPVRVRTGHRRRLRRGGSGAGALAVHAPTTQAAHRA